MKKRFMSLFLSAVLILSTLAAAIPAAAAEPNNNAESEPIAVGTDLMPLATTDAAVVNVEDGNGYLHIYDRLNNFGTNSNVVTGIGWQPEEGYQYLKGSVIYYVKLKARIANNWADQSELDASFDEDAATMYYRLTTGGSLKVFDIWADKLDNVTYSGYNGDRWDVNPNIPLAGFVGNPSNFKQINKSFDLYGKFTDEYENLPAADYTFKAHNEGVDVALTNEWITFAWAFIPRMDYTVGWRGNQYFIAFSSAAGAYRNIPVDIDDFEVWYYDENGVKQTCAFYDFDDPTVFSSIYEYEPRNRYGKMFSVHGATRQGFNKHFKASNIKEFDYLEVGSPVIENNEKQSVSGGTLNYYFPADTRLDAGVYELTAEARLNFYDGYLENEKTNKLIPQFIENEDNKARLEIKDNYNNSLGVNEISSEWSTVTYTLTIPKGKNYTLTELNAVFSDDTASVNKAFNLRNVKFVKTEAFIPDTEFEESAADVVYTIEDDAFTVSNGADGAKVEMVYPASYEQGNKYLTVKNRTNERDGFILDLRGIVDNSEENDYRLSFRIRASRELSNLKINSNDSKYNPAWSMIKLSAGLYRGNYVTAAPSTFEPSKYSKISQTVNYYRHTLGSSKLFWWYFGNDEWHTVDIPFNDFVFNEEGVLTRYDVIHFGGAETAYNAVNFDIDDITVYSTGKGEIWKQDFQDEKVGELSDSMTASFIPFKETWLPDEFRTEKVALEISEDAPYLTAKNVSELKYTPEYTPIILDPGVYTIYAEFSYPYFDGSRVTTAAGGSKNRNYIESDSNKFEVSAYVETADGTEVFTPGKLADVTVGNSWKQCGFKFRVDEKAEIKSIIFKFTDASGAEYTTVCYRNIYIDGTYPTDKTLLPHVGIIMTLLYRKKAVIEAENDNIHADEDRVLSDKAAVYPIIDNNFKVVSEQENSKLTEEYPGSFEAGNRYLRVSGRTNNRDGIILDLRRAVLDVSDANYRLSFKVRSTSKIVDIWTNDPLTGPFSQKDVLRLGEGLYNGAYTPASPSVFSKATITSDGFNPSVNGWYFDNNSWTTVDVAFTELKNQNVIHIGGGALGCNTSDFDIDDIMVYIEGEEEPIYIESFEEAALGELSANLSYFYVPFKNGNVGDSYRPYGITLEVAEDLNYLTVSDASELEYTVPESDKISLAAGAYTLHADFSYPCYDGKIIELAQTDDSKKQYYFKTNGNAFDVTAVIETDNGTLTLDKYTVRNGWTECEFNFKVDTATEVKSVSFKLTPANGSVSCAVNLREVYIDGDPTK